jgi:helicase
MELPEFHHDIARISIRIQYGVKSELIPLVKLKNIGRVRARRLYNAGITSPSEIRTADLAVLTRILGKYLTRQLRGEDKGYAGDSLANKNKRQISMFSVDDITKLPGIGEKLGKKLRSCGLHSVSDILKADNETLAAIIGTKRAEHLLTGFRKEEDEKNKTEIEKKIKARKGQWSISDFL